MNTHDLGTGRNLRLTFREEQQRNRIRIILLIIPLAVFYAFSFTGVAFIAALVIHPMGLLPLLFSPHIISITIGISALVAVLHYLFAREVVMDRLHAGILVTPPDPFDAYHLRLMNIVDELSIAAGITPPELHVIPTTAANAFALEAGGARRVYVTEGAISLLSRDELQGVIAHVLAHLSTGDSETGTLMIALSNALGFLSAQSAPQRLATLQEPRSLLAALLLHAYAFIAIVLASSLSALISRNRKFLADAVAVEITRHPEALADALYRMQVLSRQRMTVACDELGIVCVVPPLYRVLDESSGLLASVISVHPPVHERIARLSRYPLDVVEQRLREAPPPTLPPPTRYFAHRDDVWQGPYSFSELATLAGLTPDTWVCAENARDVNLMAAAPWFQEWLRHRASAETSPRLCARCRGPLLYDYQAGVRLERCSACGGTQVSRTRLQKIILRSPRFTSNVRMLAGKHRRRTAADTAEIYSKLAGNDDVCPRCQVSMVRKYFAIGHSVVIDECPNCHLVYLDPGEIDNLLTKDM